eukprot:359062-Chlamydomonas_euryale.AAC.15
MASAQESHAVLLLKKQLRGGCHTYTNSTDCSASVCLRATPPRRMHPRQPAATAGRCAACGCSRIPRSRAAAKQHSPARLDQNGG